MGRHIEVFEKNDQWKIDMKLFLKILIVIFGVTGCGYDWNSETSNATVVVHNETNSFIIVYYQVEIDSIEYEGTYHEENQIRIEYGESESFLVEEEFWDGQIEVQYGENRKTFDLDFDIWGYASIHIKIDDFNENT